MNKKYSLPEDDNQEEEYQLYDPYDENQNTDIPY